MRIIGAANFWSPWLSSNCANDLFYSGLLIQGLGPYQTHRATYRKGQYNTAGKSSVHIN